MTYLNAYKQLNNQLFDFCQFSNAVIVGAMASKKFSKVLNFIDPLLIYVVVVYGLTKVCENIFAVESVWQVLWDKLQIVLGKLVGFPLNQHYDVCRFFEGDDPFMYCVVLLNCYTNALYWIFGLSLMLFEKIDRPKGLAKYKIQMEKSTINDGPKIMMVMKL
jgi:hypothetical protein